MMLCYVMLCYVMGSVEDYVMLCYFMLCYVMVSVEVYAGFSLQDSRHVEGRKCRTSGPWKTGAPRACSRAPHIGVAGMQASPVAPQAVANTLPSTMCGGGSAHRSHVSSAELASLGSSTA